ncbi:outer membrane assembly protein AsmA [Dickeya sp. CFBP 2040]|uniref:outer membrane assembly protein AsmA n=1 Tax=Dickeya sp. CFBP 2040 TaxID=2718531 RepID=UPI0014487C03|nr:outer membrane assembly protein AsmA [Dickeya sp. CFBP 2040]NKI74134.1 outer membrane assembly protein AsmA [Dickeya sp. CFBP 2040]
MRRVFTALVILLVVLAAGMTALVVLINPNDFRAYMVHQVEARSGYRLNLDGDLRWHVWPQLSILSGTLSVSAPGAATPVISAENMRLDVKLWPLLSHQLEVKQVMLKGAVIRLTPDSEARVAGPVPIAPAGSPSPEPETPWRFDINRVEVADSVLVFQRRDAPALNVRDINLTLESDNTRQVRVSLSSRFNRDQRDLSFSLDAVLGMQNYPQQIGADISSISYQLQGAGLPAEGISGKGAIRGSYQRQPEKLTVNQFTLSANNSQLNGSLSATFGTTPEYTLALQSEKLDLDALLGLEPPSQRGESGDKTVIAKPVFSHDQLSEPYQGLRNSIDRVTVSVNTLVYHGITVNQFALKGSNQRGTVKVTDFSGQVGEGHFSIPGTMNVNVSPAITIQPTLTSVTLATLLPLFGLPDGLDGKLSLQGRFSGDDLSQQALITQWRGSASVQIDQLRLSGLNIQQLIQQAVARNNSSIQVPDDYSRYTDIRQMRGEAMLDAGKLDLQSLSGQSEALTVNGDGQFDLPAQRCDINMDVRVTQGWKGDGQWVQLLQDTAIPFRLYGEFGHLNYQLQVDQLLRKRLQDEMKKRLNDWADKNQPTSKTPATGM